MAAAVVALAATKLAFWQRVLASEADPARLAAILEEVSDEASFLSHPALTDGERRRAVAAGIEPAEAAVRNGARLIAGEAIPEILHELPYPPPALFFRGDPVAFEAPAVAIVGTRHCSTYGKAVAQKFAESLAREGVTIVSGGALGIDAAAHQGALAVGGRTIAVFGTAIDLPYPAVHGSLFREIEARGGLVSSFACGTKTRDYRFRMRNGLVAALSLAVLVVEAPVGSGALYTAQFAAEMGRDVFVVPADIHRRTFHGAFGLMRDGAQICWNPRQILAALDIEPTARASTSESEGAESPILRVLGPDPLSAEAIVEQTGLSAPDVLAELTMLELDGLVIRDSLGYAKPPRV
ncbi:DNA-processing protein DprA [soil metagenome]